MHVKSVVCCQCGSPLLLPENAAEVRFLQCQHCSASLEVQDLEHGSITRIHSDLNAIQEATAEHARLLEELRLEQELVRLDREWQQEWGEQSNASVEKAYLGAILMTLLIVPFAVITLGMAWSARAPFTPQEAKQFSESMANSMHQFSYFGNRSHTSSPVPAPIPYRPHVPARVGSVLVVIALSGLVRFFWRYAKRFAIALEEYQSRRQTLQLRISFPKMRHG